MSLEIGDVVYHKATKEQMVVTETPETDTSLDKGYVKCEFKKNGDYITEEFKESSLEG